MNYMPDISAVLLIILSSTVTALFHVVSERYLDRLRKLDNRLKADEKALILRPTDEQIRKFREHPSVSIQEIQEFLEYVINELPGKWNKITAKLAKRRRIFIFTYLLSFLLFMFFMLYPLNWPYGNIAPYGVRVISWSIFLNSILQIIWSRKIDQEMKNVDRELDKVEMYLALLKEEKYGE